MDSNKNLKVWAIVLFLLVGVLVYKEHVKLGNAIWNTLHEPKVALFLNPSPSLANQIGDYYFNMDRSGKVYNPPLAEIYYKKALALDPTLPIAWHQLARIEFVLGDFNSAHESIDQQITLHGDSLINAYYVRGLINGYMNNLREAESDFAYFLEHEPKSWAARNDLAWIYFRQGDYKNVEITAREGLRYNPNNPWLLTSLGVALLNLDKKPEAKKTLEAALVATNELTIADWGRAYPGNDPKSYDTDIREMKHTIDYNLNLTGG